MKSYQTLQAVTGDKPPKPPRRMIVTVFDAIAVVGHDEDYEPPPIIGEFEATSAPPGSAEKIDILAKRVELGKPLWHPEDRVDYVGLTGCIVPREKSDPRAKTMRHEAKMPTPRKEVGSGD